MYHPDIIAAYGYTRIYAQRRPVDACTDIAEFYGVSVASLARFLVVMRLAVRIESDQLSLLF